MISSTLALLALLPALTLAQIGSLRASLPGSLHQCEATNIVFFQSGGTRPLDLVFLPYGSVPASLRTGTTTVDEVVKYGPLLTIEGIDSLDANAFDFTLQIPTGDVFEIFAFYPDGTGKALTDGSGNLLTRSVQTALPAATSCLTGVKTTISGVAAAAATTTAAAASETTTRAAATSSSASRTRASSSSSTTPAPSNSAAVGAPSASSGAANPSAAAASASTPPTGGASSLLSVGGGSSSSGFAVVAGMVGAIVAGVWVL